MEVRGLLAIGRLGFFLTWDVRQGSFCALNKEGSVPVCGITPILTWSLRIRNRDGVFRPVCVLSPTVSVELASRRLGKALR